MASPWIKVEKATARKPEVLRIAELLSIHPDHAFGLCFRFWSWCDDQLKDGHACVPTLSSIDAVICHAGFAEALISVGWLRVREGSLEVPNFDRHLSESAKNRALSAERKQAQRAKNRVTKASRKCPTKNGTPLILSYLSVLDDSFRNKEFEEAIKSWIEFRKEKRNPLTPTSVKQQAKWFAEIGCREAIATIEHTIRKGWIGLQQPDEKKSNGRTTKHGPGQVYDPDAAKPAGFGTL